MNLLHYIPYILLFALVTMLLYGWGLWRARRQSSDLNRLLYSKGIAKVKKALRKNGPMTQKELVQTVQEITVSQPYSRNRIGVTEPMKFLDTLLSYMLTQKLLCKEELGGAIRYRLP